MHLLHESEVAAVSGGGTTELDPDSSSRPGHPVPIWHPVFVTDP